MPLTQAWQFFIHTGHWHKPYSFLFTLATNTSQTVFYSHRPLTQAWQSFIHTGHWHKPYSFFIHTGHWHKPDSFSFTLATDTSQTVFHSHWPLTQAIQFFYSHWPLTQAWQSFIHTGHWHKPDSFSFTLATDTSQTVFHSHWPLTQAWQSFIHTGHWHKPDSLSFTLATDTSLTVFNTIHLKLHPQLGGFSLSQIWFVDVLICSVIA